MADELKSECNTKNNEKYENNLLKEKVVSLERFISSSKLQLAAENKRCESLREKAWLLTQDKLSLEKKLTEMECKYAETKKELDIMKRNNLSLKETVSELEIALSEDTIQEKVLQENIDKLEELTCTLREQRDEQSSYFKQKEECLKSNHERFLNKIKQEKANTVKELTEVKLENVSLKDEIKHIQDSQQQSITETSRLEDEVDCISSQLQRTQKDLECEKQTVQDLLLKNNDLTTTVTRLKANQEKMNGEVTRLPKHTTAMIEDMVQKFYEKKFKIASEFNEKRTSELTKQITGYEITLTEERRRRQKLEFRLEEAEIELRKARSNVDSMFELSVKRTRASLNRCNNIKSVLQKPLTLTPTLRNPLFDVTQIFNTSKVKPGSSTHSLLTFNNDANEATISPAQSIVGRADVTQSFTVSVVSDVESDVSCANTSDAAVSEVLTSVSANSELLT